jgi:hypothetical protein
MRSRAPAGADLLAPGFTDLRVREEPGAGGEIDTSKRFGGARGDS